LDARARAVPLLAIAARWIMTLSLFGVTFLSFAYAGLSAYAASNLVSAPQVVAETTPAAYKLDFRPVTFASRTDHMGLSGWFIPGVGPKNTPTDKQTIIVVHSARANRDDSKVGLLALSAALAKAGFAVLAFDLRGSGLSQGAPQSLGYFEQRDVLGAVDFLQNGPMPYPKLGRPQAIGAWGVSMGAAALLLAAAHDTAIQAIVADSAYADALPILERDIPKQSGLPAWFTPGVLMATQSMYGIDFRNIRPVNVVASIAPRPILFIQGDKDTVVPASDLTELSNAAQQGPGAQITVWSVPDAGNGQAYNVAGQAYVDKLVTFFRTNLPIK
jgi:fermentation-respiration switch protein FrsA (DUF1100 family)